MATIINTPGSNEGGNTAGWIIGIVALILVILLGIFVLPKIMNPQPATVVVPTSDNSTVPPIVNNYTTINASSTTNNSTTTNP